MRFFTKEWYKDTILAEMCFQLNTSSKAAVFSDKLYNSLLSDQKKYFIKERKRIAKYNKAPFDQAAAEADFEENYKENLEFVKTNLPEEILDRVADIRVLALGTAEYEITQEITRFCGRVNRRCEEIKNRYEAELEQLSQKLGWYKINALNMLINAPLVEISNSDSGRLTLRTSAEYTDVACKVTLFDGETVFEDEGIQGCAICQTELVQNDEGKLEFNLLCLDLDGNTKEFSAICSDIETEELLNI